MEKPIALLKKELRFQIVDLANGSGLPMDDIAEVFRKLHEEAANIVKEREQEEINQYYLSLPSPETKNGEKDEQDISED